MIGREAYLETHVLSADPMELICLLYQHATDAVRESRRCLAGGDIPGRSKAISKTLGILGELSSSLDPKAEGTIGSSLVDLYAYMTLRLTEANVRQQDGPLAEVESLLTTLGQAWEEARQRQAAASAPPVPPPSAAWQGSNLEPVAHGWNA